MIVKYRGKLYTVLADSYLGNCTLYKLASRFAQGARSVLASRFAPCPHRGAKMAHYARDLRVGMRFQFVNAFGNVPVGAPVYRVTHDAQRASEPGYWIVRTDRERWSGRGRSPCGYGVTMHTSRTATINRAIAAAGVEHITLRPGRGYQYFQFDDGVVYETQSVMVCYVKQLTVAEWVERAKDWEAAF